VLEWADAQGGLGLFLHLGELPLSGPVADALRDVLAEQSRNAAVVSRKNHVMLQSDLSPEAYFDASVSGKKRKEYRRQANRLSELGKVEFIRHEDEDDLSQWSEDFLALERAGWKGRQVRPSPVCPKPRHYGAMPCAGRRRGAVGTAVHDAGWAAHRHVGHIHHQARRLHVQDRL
jgi:hypothetical protein